MSKFQLKKITKRQILNQKIYKASDFDEKVLQRVRFWFKIFFASSEFELNFFQLFLMLLPFLFPLHVLLTSFCYMQHWTIRAYYIFVNWIKHSPPFKQIFLFFFSPARLLIPLWCPNFFLLDLNICRNLLLLVKLMIMQLELFWSHTFDYFVKNFLIK